VEDFGSIGFILGSIRPYLALLAASMPQRDKNRARLIKFLRFELAQCEQNGHFYRFTEEVAKFLARNKPT
jgi:hypothetical protein